jgi:hypothetical protein
MMLMPGKEMSGFSGLAVADLESPLASLPFDGSGAGGLVAVAVDGGGAGPGAVV